MATYLVAVGEQVCADCGEPIPFKKGDKMFGIKKCGKCGHKHMITPRIMGKVTMGDKDK